jgi:hypothetical protein
MIRDLGFIQWKDPLAWMESMKGSRWARTVASENLHFHKAVEAHSKKVIIPKEETLSFECGPIRIKPNGTLSYTWTWIGSTKPHEAAALDYRDNTVYAIEADSEGNEVYTLVCYTQTKMLWRYKTSIAPYICVKDGLCYLIEAVGTLQYRRLISIDAATGKGRRLLFEETSQRNNLFLKNGFLISDNSGRQALYTLPVKRVCEDGISFFPVSGNCYFARLGSFEAPWKLFGAEYKLPPLNDGLEFFSLKTSLLLSSSGGVRSLYKCSADKAPVKLREFIGTCVFDTFCTESMYITNIPGSTQGLYDGKRLIRKEEVYARHTLHTSISADGTRVPYVLVAEKTTVKGLMIIVYGGYCIPTKMDTHRWRVYLQAGWGLVFGFIRGGGDFGDSWADAARTYKKGKSVEDAKAVIRSAQELTGMSWTRTCIYGRSAGGYVVGSIVSRHARGGLIGAAYAEVPYVDILRTTTNPALPLTVLEYDEFGNPAEKLEDLEAILRLSPIDSLPEEGAPAIFVVARTSLNDKEVLAYESVKWITKLRGSTGGGEQKLLALTGGQGHFVRGSLDVQQKTEDFILLNRWLESRV